MIKKILAGCIIVYALFMGFVVVKGVLSKNSPVSKNASSNTQNAQKIVTNSSRAQSNANKTYTISDVSAHATMSDCWIVISGSAYDVTGYINQHPGGAREIVRYCGKDATAGFDTQGGRGSHSSQAKSILANFLIGTIK